MLTNDEKVELATFMVRRTVGDVLRVLRLRPHIATEKETRREAAAIVIHSQAKVDRMSRELGV